MLELYRNIKKRRLELDMTQSDLAKKLGYSDKSMIAKIEKGAVDLSQSKITAFAKALKTTEVALMGWDDSSEPAAATGHNMSALPKEVLEQLKPVKIKSFPMLGYVACGEPIFADKNFEAFVMADADIDADYCLTCKGDSMINARIYDGDIVFIKSCSMVDNGDIALVVIDNDVTLKRVYYYPDEQLLKLVSENPLYAPFVYSGAELEQIHILGKAVMFQSIVR